MLKTIFSRKREAEEQLHRIEKIYNELMYDLFSKGTDLKDMSDDEVSYYIWKYPHRNIIASIGYNLTRYGKSSRTYGDWKKRFGKRMAEMLMGMYLMSYELLLLLQHNDEIAWEVSETLDSLCNI